MSDRISIYKLPLMMLLALIALATTIIIVFSIKFRNAEQMAAAPLLNENYEFQYVIELKVVANSPNDIEIIFINNSPYYVEFHGGRPFVIEQFGITNWRTRRLQPGFGFTDDLGTMPPYSERHFNLWLAPYRDELQAGRLYRARMDATFIHADRTQIPWQRTLISRHDIVVEFYAP